MRHIQSLVVCCLLAANIVAAEQEGVSGQRQNHGERPFEKAMHTWHARAERARKSQCTWRDERQALLNNWKTRPARAFRLARGGLVCMPARARALTATGITARLHCQTAPRAAPAERYTRHRAGSCSWKAVQDTRWEPLSRRSLPLGLHHTYLKDAFRV